MASYLVGKDPRPITQHWQAIYRHGFYRGGPVLTAVLSGIDMALWDIKGKALGLPVHELLGGPTRQKIRVYGNRRDIVEGRCSAMKTQLTADGLRAPYKYVEGPGYVQRVTKSFAQLREALGADVDIGVEFHGASQPSTSLLIMKALEPYQPFFYEEPVQCQNVDAMAALAAKTHIPVATGERIYTKWGFREILEKKAASILQPDVCYAGGITELKLIAGMAEVHYVPLARITRRDPARWRPVARLRPRSPISWCKSRAPGHMHNMLKNPFQIEKGFLPVPTAPDWASNSTKQSSWPWSAILARIGERTTATTVRWWIGNAGCCECDSQSLTDPNNHDRPFVKYHGGFPTIEIMPPDLSISA